MVLEERKQLQYYHPVCPKADMEINAVVSHINNPADFYIQVVQICSILYTPLAVCADINVAFQIFPVSPCQVENMELTLLSAQLQDCYNAATNAANLTVYCPVIGQAYVARDDDKLWHRAQVISEGLFSCNNCVRYYLLLQITFTLALCTDSPFSCTLV